jgi:hypothetical protein
MNELILILSAINCGINIALVIALKIMIKKFEEMRRFLVLEYAKIVKMQTLEKKEEKSSV